jgi:hypothetical protein
MQLEKLRRYAKPGDIVLTGGSGFLSKLIKYAQRGLTIGLGPSRWSHVLIYVDSDIIAESTIDTEPFRTTKKRLDNGVQYNYLKCYKDTKDGMLLHFDLTETERIKLLAKADAMIACGYRYSILGLFGSLLAYYIFPWMKSNPLGLRRSLYCSAFVQEVYKSIDIDFDPKRTSRNTSPESISQFTYPGLMKYDISEGGPADESSAFNDALGEWIADT